MSRPKYGNYGNLFRLFSDVYLIDLIVENKLIFDKTLHDHSKEKFCIKRIRKFGIVASLGFDLPDLTASKKPEYLITDHGVELPDEN